VRRDIEWKNVRFRSWRIDLLDCRSHGVRIPFMSEFSCGIMKCHVDFLPFRKGS
jgi:hypothetical protein